MATKFTLVFKLDGAPSSFRANLDGQALNFGVSGSASAEVEPGIHVIQIFALGPPGTSFRLTIRVSKAQSQLWSRGFTLPADGIVAASKKIVVPEIQSTELAGKATKWPGPRKK